MTPRRLTLQAIVLACLLVFAGCTSVADEGTNSPSTQPTTSPSPSSISSESYFIFQNGWNAPPPTADNFTYTVTLYVTNTPVTAYRVIYPDGRVKTYNGSIPSNATLNATHVAPTTVFLTRTYEVKPRSTLYVELQNFSKNHTLIYNYGSQQELGVGFNHATTGNGSDGPWFVQIEPGEYHVSAGGEYKDELNTNTTYRTITLNRSRSTTS